MTRDPRTHSSEKKRGFTLLQLLVVISLIAVLSALLFGVLGRGRSAARRSQCELHLKEIAMALDTYRQENGRMPSILSDLVAKKYVSAETLRCPNDTELKLHANNLSYSSYSDMYVVREPRDSGELPILVCPWHETDGFHGVQAYKGRYTTQYITRPATVRAGQWSGVVTISRTGEGILSNPVSAAKPLLLHGGDRVKTGAGTVTVAFADGSNATVQPNSEMSILQTYIEGQRSGPLYTLTRQFSGRVNYYVNPGSHFDVATPTATAGALGTRFTIDILPDSPEDANTLPETLLTVTEHVVALSTLDRTVEVKDTEAALIADSAADRLKERKPRRRGAGRRSMTALPVTTPTPTPTPTPCSGNNRDGNCEDGNNGKGNG